MHYLVHASLNNSRLQAKSWDGRTAEVVYAQDSMHFKGWRLNLAGIPGLLSGFDFWVLIVQSGKVHVDLPQEIWCPSDAIKIIHVEVQRVIKRVF